MSLGRSTRQIWNIALQQLNDHKCLWALVFPLAGVGAMAVSIVSYSSSKPEVVFNRWKFVSPQDLVKWDRPQYKLVSFPREKPAYAPDLPLQELLKEVYEDKRYTGRI